MSICQNCQHETGWAGNHYTTLDCLRIVERERDEAQSKLAEDDDTPGLWAEIETLKQERDEARARLDKAQSALAFAEDSLSYETSRMTCGHPRACRLAPGGQSGCGWCAGLAHVRETIGLQADSARWDKIMFHRMATRFRCANAEKRRYRARAMAIW